MISHITIQTKNTIIKNRYALKFESTDLLELGQCSGLRFLPVEPPQPAKLWFGESQPSEGIIIDVLELCHCDDLEGRGQLCVVLVQLCLHQELVQLLGRLSHDWGI